MLPSPSEEGARNYDIAKERRQERETVSSSYSPNILSTRLNAFN